MKYICEHANEWPDCETCIHNTPHKFYEEYSCGGGYCIGLYESVKCIEVVEEYFDDSLFTIED